jgi:hypothetical protein
MKICEHCEERHVDPGAETCARCGQERAMADLENQGHRSGCAIGMARDGKPCWCGQPYKDGRRRRGR